MICEIFKQYLHRRAFELHKKIVHNIVSTKIYKCEYDYCKRVFNIKRSFQRRE